MEDPSERLLASRAAALMRHAVRGNESDQADLLEFLDGVPACVGWATQDLRYRFVNRSYESLCGRPREEIIDRHVAEVMGEDAFSRCLPHISRALAGKRASFTTTLPLHGANARLVSCKLLPRRDREDRPDGYFVLVEPLDDQP